MAEEIEIQKCNFRNFRSPMTSTLTLERVEVTRMRISGRGLPTHQIRSKSGKLLVDGRNYGRMDITYNIRSIGTSPGYDLKIDSLVQGNVF